MVKSPPSNAHPSVQVTSGRSGSHQEKSSSSSVQDANGRPGSRQEKSSSPSIQVIGGNSGSQKGGDSSSSVQVTNNKSGFLQKQDSDALPVFDRRRVPSRVVEEPPSEVLEEEPKPPSVAPIVTRLKQTIYLAFLGAPSLDELRKISRDKGQWSEFKKLLTDRTNNVNVIAVLVVTSSAVYVAANPPTNISTWHAQFPYVCMLGSYGGGMLSIVFGISQIVYLSFMGPADIDVSVALGYSIFFLIPVVPATNNDHRRCRRACSSARLFSRY
ncbi:hypothetical protein EDC04DRAFT_1490652 [Pisolithus marmoratus]|nr:hypothetical protein EDC04DRAFT_1490652 [Pisolithus marmoratus]